MKPTNWNIEAKKILKRELKQKGISHDALVRYLSAIGVEETKASIDSKISRGTFSASFLIQCLTAINSNQIELPIQESTDMTKSTIHQIFPVKDQAVIYLDKLSQTKYIDISATESENTNKELTVISLFSGAGGIDIGLEEAGFQTLVCVDNNIDCRETLKYNRPDWIVFESTSKEVDGETIERAPGNIREIDPEELLEVAGVKKGDVTLVVGGAPCQPFSNIGKKQGKDDEKNGDLFLEFVKMIRGIEPQAFIFENVAGITQKKHAEVITYMKNQFQGMDYGISHTILNAANYGVAQRRERFFLIGIKNVEEPAFPLPTHFKDEKSWDGFIRYFEQTPLSRPQKWVTIKDVFNRLPKNYKKRSDYAVMGVSEIVEKRMRYIKQGQNFKVLPDEMRPNCWRTGKHQGSDTFGRLVADQPSVTIRTAAYNSAKGRYIHPFENRGLDTIEMAAIQSFPYEWVFRSKGRDQITLVSGGRQIGNAVPPLLAKVLGIAIREQISDEQEYQQTQPLLAAQS